jgi:biotin carboxylase
MAEKTLLVLAASTYQLDAIRKAKELGMRVITTDNLPSNPGHRLADRSYCVDTTDREGVLGLARQERIDGVIAPATDVALETAAYVAAALALPGPSVESTSILTSKWQFRQFLKGNGLPCPRFFYATSNAGTPHQVDFGRGPWIIKPNRSSGSKGIVIVDHLRDIEEHLRKAKQFSLDGQAIIEECLDGTQHTCEGFLSNGDLAFVLVTDRKTAPRPYTATAGHFVPSRLDRRSQTDALTQLKTVFSALGVRDGPFDCDFLCASDGIYLLEVTVRLGGNSLAALVEESCAFDIVKAAVRYACGEKSSVPESLEQRPAAVLILGASAAGRLWFDPDNIAALKREPWVRRLLLDHPQGAPVRAFVNGRERIGEALFTGRDRDELDRRALQLTRRLGPIIQTEAAFS